MQSAPQDKWGLAKVKKFFEFAVQILPVIIKPFVAASKEHLEKACLIKWHFIPHWSTFLRDTLVSVKADVSQSSSKKTWVYRFEEERFFLSLSFLSICKKKPPWFILLKVAFFSVRCRHNTLALTRGNSRASPRLCTTPNIATGHETTHTAKSRHD